MEKIRFGQIIKHSKCVYTLFSCTGKYALLILKKLVGTDKTLILFNSFGGKKYDDSPKVIYEKMIEDQRFSNYKMYWAFNDPDHFPNVKNRLKTDNLKYFVTALRARCWITNSSIQRGIDFKGEKTVCFNTWHGSPIKKMGYAVSENYNNKIINNNDLICAQGQYDIDSLSIAWGIPKDRFIITGLPRNDDLVNVQKERIISLKEKLGIPQNKKVILYAPTFRDYQLDKLSQVKMTLPINFDYWEKELGEEWVFILRAHYEVSRNVSLPNSGMWYDYSDYEALNDLMIVSDVLISDYSSIIFDYSILERPILGFTFDYEEYEKKRGLYFDIRNELTCFGDSIQLAQYIQSLNHEIEVEKVKKFRKKYIQEYGNAGDKAVDAIYELLSKNN